MSQIRHVRVERGQATLASDPIFIGPVAIQELVNDAQASLLRVTAVTFEEGARNRAHRHGADQILIATAGRGYVATENERHQLVPGDVALIPAGTRHWHGAEPGVDFTHLSILTPGHMEILDDADEEHR
jgi:quercetin dioxygenase-like cupin family protein